MKSAAVREEDGKDIVRQETELSLWRPLVGTDER